MVGTLSTISATELESIVIKESVNRAGIKPEDVKYICVLCYPGGVRAECGKTGFHKSRTDGNHNCRKYQCSYANQALIA